MKKKYFIACIIFLLSFFVTKAQTVLTAGDIVITGFNSDNPDEFTFVLLTDIVATTTINFTDRGWVATGGFRIGEGILTWTADTDLTCGTEITILDNINPFVASIGSVTDSSQFRLATNGDQILAYQGPATTPTFLYAIHFANTTGWTNATTPQTSAVPAGLTDGVNAVYIGNFDNGNYDCSVTNDPTLVLAAVSTAANWAGNNTRIATLGGCYYTCCTSTVTWSGVWTPNSGPNSTTEVIINAPYNTATDGSFDACSLTLNANLSIDGTDYVQVVNSITINNNTILYVASEASLVQINDASIVTLNGTGTGILQKITTPLQAYYSYTYWSSPFVNEAIGEAASGMDLVPTSRIFEYNASNFEDTDTDGFDDNSNDWVVASGAMIPGKGYAAFAQSSTMAFPQTQTYNFDGKFNNGIVTTPITVSAAAADPNWNFLGNPYPSGINADDFILNNPNLGGTFYLWTHNSAPLAANPGPDNLNFSVDDYAAYTPGTGGIAAVSGGTIPTNVIASGQGFFIEALNAGAATFNNSMRVTTGNDNFFRATNNTLLNPENDNFFRATDRIWLNLENDYGAFSQILIGFADGATNGIDRLYDGKRLDASSYISFFSVIEDEHYAIQGRSAITEETTIPLGIKNDVPGENKYKISLDNVEGLLETSELFLVDKLLNITHNLNSGAYVFNSEEGVFKNRFELLMRPTTLATDDFLNTPTEELIITKSQDNSISFTTANGSQIQNIQIFDVLGRQLYNTDFNEENRIKFKELEHTIFIVKATLVNGNVLTKKALK